MSNEVLIGLLSLLGTVLGSAGGVLASQKLTNFRLQQLENKINEHNQVIKRTFVLEEQIKVANHRIDDLEELQHAH